jgi:hypothetical protein
MIHHKERRESREKTGEKHNSPKRAQRAQRNTNERFSERHSVSVPCRLDEPATELKKEDSPQSTQRTQREEMSKDAERESMGAHRERLIGVWRQRPFQPFRIIMTHDESVEVRDPDLLGVGATIFIVVLLPLPGSPFTVENRRFEKNDIVRIESLQPFLNNPQDNPV